MPSALNTGDKPFAINAQPTNTKAKTSLAKMAAAKEKLHELEAKQPADAKLKKKQGVNTVFSK